MKIPRWLKLQEQIDYLYFCLSVILKKMPSSRIEILIDEVTGYDKKRKKEIRQICQKMKKLKREWTRETSKDALTDMEDKIIVLTNEI